jgi:hypothetical protein
MYMGVLTHDGGLSGARRWVLSLALASSKQKVHAGFRKLCGLGLCERLGGTLISI